MVLDFGIIQNNIIGQFVLPFALLFAIVYGSLRTANVFSGKQVNAIIAGVIAFIAALSAPIVSAMFDFMPLIITILVALFLYNLLYTLISGEKPGDAAKKPKKGGDVLLVVGALLIILAIKGRDFVPDLSAIDQTNLIFIFSLLGIFIIWKRGL